MAGSLDPAITKTAETWLQAHSAEVKAPGFVAGVVENGALAHFKSFGFANIEKQSMPTSETIYRIGSLSKVFTAIGILQLRDRGKLRLDDRLTDLIPELKTIRYPSPSTPQITLRDMLTHSSSLPRMATGGDWISIQDIVKFSSSIELKASPGSRFWYSNLGFALLGEVIARVSGTSWEEYTRINIIQPLGMTHTYFHEGEFQKDQMATPYNPVDGGGWQEIPSPELYGYASAGAIYSTIPDLAKFMSFAFMPDDSTAAVFNSILTEESRSEMQRPQYVTNMGEGSAMGFPWFISTNKNGSLTVGHGGNIDGFECQFVFDPHRNIGAIVLANNINAGLHFVGAELLKAVQKTKISREMKSMREVSQRLLAALKDPNEATLKTVMTEQILGDGGTQLFIEVFQDQITRFGTVDSIKSIKGLLNYCSKKVQI